MFLLLACMMIVLVWRCSWTKLVTASCHCHCLSSAFLCCGPCVVAFVQSACQRWADVGVVVAVLHGRTFQTTIRYHHYLFSLRLYSSSATFLVALPGQGYSRHKTGAVLPCEPACMWCFRVAFEWRGRVWIMVITEICKAPTLWLKALNKHNTHNAHQGGEWYCNLTKAST